MPLNLPFPFIMSGGAIALILGLVALDIYLSPLPIRSGGTQPGPTKNPSDDPLERVASSNSEVEHCALFRKRRFKEGAEVITGIRLAGTRAAMPRNQWCYIGRDIANGGAARTVWLAKQQGEGTIEYHELSRKAADDIGYSLAELREARKLCQFMKPGENREPAGKRVKIELLSDEFGLNGVHAT